MATLDLLTLEEAKLAVDIGVGDVEDDDKLAGYNTAASQLLDQWVGPTVQRAVTEQHEACGRGVIILELRPVVSITSVTEYVDGSGTTVAVESLTSQPSDAYKVGHYIPDPTLLDGHLRRRSSGRNWLWRGDVAVSYVAGRVSSTTSVGERFKRAAAVTLQNLWAGSLVGVQEFEPGGYQAPSTNFPAFAMPNAVRELLAGEAGTGPARRWGIA